MDVPTARHTDGPSFRHARTLIEVFVRSVCLTVFTPSPPLPDPQLRLLDNGSFLASLNAVDCKSNIGKPVLPDIITLEDLKRHE